MSELTSLLPTKKSTKPKRIDPSSIIIFGPAGVGKSTFGASLEDALIIDTEESTDFLEGIMSVDVKNSMKRFTGVIRELNEYKKQNGKMPYEYVIIDTLDGLVHDIIFPYICKQHGKKDISDFDYGAGYSHAKNMLLQYMNFFKANFKAVIYMCHYKRTVFGETEVDFDMASLNFPASIKTTLVHQIDEVGLMFSEDGTRQINFVGSDNMEGKSRAKHLSGQTIEADWDKIFIDK